MIDGQDVPLVWSPDGDFQVAYDAAGAAPEEAFAAWQAEIAIARDIEAAPSLDVTGVDRRSGDEYSCAGCWYADPGVRAHNGHADLIREGSTAPSGCERDRAPAEVILHEPPRRAHSRAAEQTCERREQPVELTGQAVQLAGRDTGAVVLGAVVGVPAHRRQRVRHRAGAVRGGATLRVSSLVVAVSPRRRWRSSSGGR